MCIWQAIHLIKNDFLHHHHPVLPYTQTVVYDDRQSDVQYLYDSI